MTVLGLDAVTAALPATRGASFVELRAAVAIGEASPIVAPGKVDERGVALLRAFVVGRRDKR